MNSLTSSPPRAKSKIRLSLSLFWLAYLLVGWSLSIHNIILFIVALFFGGTFAVSWTSPPWFGGLLGKLPQILLFSLSLSLLITLIVTVPILLTLAIIPALTTVLAWQDVQVMLPERSDIWKVLVALALLGLCMGEGIDLWILPSLKN